MGLIFFVVSVVMLFCGCSSKIDKYLIDNLAEIREFVVFGQNDYMAVSLMCGKREGEYKMDGYASLLIDFGVITINFKNSDKDVSGITYILYVGTEKYSGDLIKNPYDETYVADIGKIVDKSSNISIDVISRENKSSLRLLNIDKDWVVSPYDCLKLFGNNYKNELDKFVVNKELQGEVYVKIINDYDVYASDFYFYINFIGRSGSTISMLISPKTGSVLSTTSQIV